MILNTYTSDNSLLKYMKQKLIEINRKIRDNSTIIVGDLNTLVMDRTNSRSTTEG